MATAGTTKKLYMEFKLDNGKTATITLADPKTGIADTDIRPVMTNICEKQALVVGSAVAESISDAYIKETTTTDII